MKLIELKNIFLYGNIKLIWIYNNSVNLIYKMSNPNNLYSKYYNLYKTFITFIYINFFKIIQIHAEVTIVRLIKT